VQRTRSAAVSLPKKPRHQSQPWRCQCSLVVASSMLGPLSRGGGTLPLLVLYGAALVARLPKQIAQRRHDRPDAADEEMTAPCRVALDPAAPHLIGQLGARDVLPVKRGTFPREGVELAPVEHAIRCRGAGEKSERPARRRCDCAAKHR